MPVSECMQLQQLVKPGSSGDALCMMHPANRSDTCESVVFPAAVETKSERGINLGAVC
jgi:hypothetical protein